MLKPVLGSQIQLGHPLARGLVGYWPMVEGTGGIITDISGNGNTGTLVADTAWAAGQHGSCLSFDGTGDYVSVGQVGELIGQITVSAWVLINADGTYSIVSKEGYSGVNPDSWWLQRHANDDVIFYVWNTDNTMASAKYTDGIPNTGEWYHVVGIYDGANVDVYVNGIKGETTGSLTGTIPDSSMDTQIAGRQGPLNGLIDNVMIYDRALSEREIQSLYREPFGMFERPSIELWSAAIQGVGGIPSANIFMGCNF